MATPNIAIAPPPGMDTARGQGTTGTATGVDKSMLEAPQTMPAAPGATPAGTPGDPGMLGKWYKDYMDAASVAPKTPSATAATWNPDEKSTVQGQLKGILDAGGPLMDRAQTRALQQMNQRGVLNSSMAIGAGQSALYDAATPIATADAGTYATSQRENAAAENAVRQQAAGFQQQGLLQTQDLASSAARQERELGSRTELAKLDIQGRKELQATEIAATADNQRKELASRFDIANLDANTRKQLQAADAEVQKSLQASDQVFKTNLQHQQLEVQQGMQKYQLAVQQAMAGKDNETKMEIAKLDAATQTKLAEINNEHKLELQTSQSMANTFSQLTASIAAVMGDPNMDAAAKQHSIDVLTNMYSANMGLQSTISGLDLGTLMIPDTGPFPGPAAPPAAPPPAAAPPPPPIANPYTENPGYNLP